MAKINIESVVGLLRQSIGIEAAEKFVNEAIEEVGFSRKSSYTEAEFKSICEALKKKGGYVKIAATVASRAAYRDIYYQEMIAKERKEKEDLARWSDTLEQRVQERAKQLKQAQAQLIQSAKMSTIGQLGAGVAHELNNPISGILGYAQFILQKLSKPGFAAKDFKDCRQYVEYIEKESKRCKIIVENLLSFSRKPTRIFEPLDIRQTIKDALSIMRHQMELQNIKITTDYGLKLPRISGNVNQLQQVFTNVILNAQHAMAKGGKLNIGVRTKMEGGKKNLEINFKDTGCGISEENLEKVFEPFFTTKQDWKSIGIGLSIAYQIIQEHKGSITVESEEGVGTTFTITLPVTSGGEKG